MEENQRKKPDLQKVLMWTMIFLIMGLCIQLYNEKVVVNSIVKHIDENCLCNCKSNLVVNGKDITSIQESKSYDFYVNTSLVESFKIGGDE